MQTFDAIVIGSGQAGTPLSKKLAKAGLKTALIEKRWVGGTCINDGCTPTKAMVASARLAHLARTSEKLGIRTGEVLVDLPAIIDRKNDIVSMFRGGSRKGLEKTENLSLIFGNARFTGNKKLSVTLENGQEQTLSAELIFINTGEAPFIPPIEGLKDIPYLTSTTLLDLTEIPDHLLIAGGGYIGLEFGQMFRRFGSKVTIIEKGEHLLPKEDRDIADCICGILQQDEIEVICGASLEKVTKTGDNINALVKTGNSQQTITCSHILIATGRTPQTKELELEQTGVTTNDRGYIEVNDQLETSQPGIYALGDVKGGPAFTHISYNDHLIVYKNLIEKANLSIKGRIVPYRMFTDPQLGRVGITEDEARKKGMNIRVATLSMEKVARAIETGETRGIMKAIVDADNGQILGAAIIGEQGGEIMSVLQMAMMGKITWQQIRENVFAHPLYSESLNNLFMSLK